MAFMGGGLASHDDSYHTGSAKRGGINGVCPIGATQKVPNANTTRGDPDGLCGIDTNLVSEGIMELVAGDQLLDSDDSSENTSSTTYTLKKTITVPDIRGTLRISFRLNTGTDFKYAYGRIYKNSVAIGTERTVFTTGFQTFSEDIAGWESGDDIELYIKAESPATAYAEQLRIRGGILPNPW